MFKNNQNGWVAVKNFFGIGSKTKISKTCANFKVSSSDSQSLKNEISKTISVTSKNMLEQAFLDNINFAQECNHELGCVCMGDSDGEEQ